VKDKVAGLGGARPAPDPAERTAAENAVAVSWVEDNRLRALAQRGGRSVVGGIAPTPLVRPARRAARVASGGDGQRLDLLQRLGHRAVGIQHQAVGGDELHIRDADEAQDVADVAGREVELRPGLGPAGGDGDDGALALQQPLGPYSEYLNVTPARATWSIQALSAAGTPKL
jgi:hypothetical protein